MIEDNVKIHDKFSIELKSTYETIFSKRKTEYNTITYLFVPAGLNINSQTYTKPKFYNDVKVYIKYKSSHYNLDDFLQLESGPFKQLEKAVFEISSKKITKKNLLNYQAKVKMFGAILNQSIIAIVDDFKNNYSPEKNSSVNNLIAQLQNIIVNYRNFINTVQKSKAPSESKKIIEYGDEYISNITTYHLIKLLTFLKKLNHNKEVILQVLRFIKEEQKYRKLNQYDASFDDDYYDEALLYKSGQLKRLIDGVLFLNREKRKDGTFFEQSVFALAAGLAMVFSTGIAFYYQLVYGNFTLPFFIILVVSYMLKDRIKSIIGLLFISKANSIFHDFKVKIKNPDNKTIGVIKENFAFVPVANLGPKVKAYRLKNMVIKSENDLLGEQIIQYKKKIIINPKKFGKEIPDANLNSLIDITRINLQRFTTQMDDPKRKYMLLKKGNIISRIGNKTYHLNLIQKFYAEDGIKFKQYNIIMNRKGIKRIEPVEI